MGPGVAVVTVFSFVMMWGNFFVPFMLLLSPDQMPASVSINDFFGNRGMVAYGQLAAFSIVYSTPVVLAPSKDRLYSWARHRLVRPDQGPGRRRYGHRRSR
ncbi:hypothetical protein STENM327S_00675 [Streptomyces tendae]